MDVEWYECECLISCNESLSVVYRIALENFEEFLKNKEIKNILKDVLIEEGMEHI